MGGAAMSNLLLLRRRGMMGKRGKTRRTITLVPSSYDNVNYEWYSASDINKGYTSETSTTYSQIQNAGMGADSYIIYKFDTSAIPDGADIVSVNCLVKVSMNGNSTTTPLKRLQMVSGTTDKGTYSTGTSTLKTHEMDCGDDWTLAEVRDIGVRAMTRSSSSTSQHYLINFYGATLTIVYEI